MNTHDCFLVVFIIVGQLGTELVIQKDQWKKKKLQVAKLENESKFERE